LALSIVQPAKVGRIIGKTGFIRVTLPDISMGVFVGYFFTMRIPAHLRG